MNTKWLLAFPITWTVVLFAACIWSLFIHIDSLSHFDTYQSAFSIAGMLISGLLSLFYGYLFFAFLTGKQSYRTPLIASSLGQLVGSLCTFILVSIQVVYPDAKISHGYTTIAALTIPALLNIISIAVQKSTYTNTTPRWKLVVSYIVLIGIFASLSFIITLLATFQI